MILMILSKGISIISIVAVEIRYWHAYQFWNDFGKRSEKIPWRNEDNDIGSAVLTSTP